MQPGSVADGWRLGVQEGPAPLSGLSSRHTYLSGQGSRRAPSRRRPRGMGVRGGRSLCKRSKGTPRAALGAGRWSPGHTCLRVRQTFLPTSPLQTQTLQGRAVTGRGLQGTYPTRRLVLLRDLDPVWN